MKGGPILNIKTRVLGGLLIVSSSLGYCEDLEIDIDYPEPGASIVELARIGSAPHPKDLAMSRETVFISSDGAQVTCLKKIEGSYFVILRTYENDLRKNILEEFVWPLGEKEARPFLDLWGGWLRVPVYRNFKFNPDGYWTFAVMDGPESFEGRIRRHSDRQEHFSDQMASLIRSIHIVSVLNDQASGEPEALKKLPGSPSQKEINERYAEKRREVQSAMIRLQALLVNPKRK